MVVHLSIDKGKFYCVETGKARIQPHLFPYPARIQAERLKLLEESLSRVPPTRRPDSKFSSSKDGASSSGGGKSGQATAAASEQKQQGVPNNGGVKVPGGETAEGARGGGDASDEGIFEILTVSDDKWISPDLPPEAGKQLDNHVAAGGGGGGGGGSSSGSSSRPGIGGRGTHYGRPTGVGLLTPQQLAGIHKVSQRRVP